VGRVDHQFDVQPVVAQHVGSSVAVLRTADKCGGVGEGHGLSAGFGHQRGTVAAIGGDIGMGGTRQRNGAVEEVCRPGDGLRPALRVVALAFGGAGQGIGAVERVIERPPSRVGGVQGKARVHHRHDKLGPGDAGDFGVHVFRADGEVRAFGDQVADLFQEGAVGLPVERLATAGGNPVVDLCLQRVPLFQQAQVFGNEVAQHGGIAAPEGLGGQIQAGQDAVLHQIGENGCDLKPGAFDIVGHVMSP
jgi:hypothetical protein